jgi:hypothetical protein
LRDYRETRWESLDLTHGGGGDEDCTNCGYTGKTGKLNLLKMSKDDSEYLILIILSNTRMKVSI